MQLSFVRLQWEASYESLRLCKIHRSIEIYIYILKVSRWVPSLKLTFSPLKIWWLEDSFPLGKAYLHVRAVSFRECNFCIFLYIYLYIYISGFLLKLAFLPHLELSLPTPSEKPPHFRIFGVSSWIFCPVIRWAWWSRIFAVWWWCTAWADFTSTQNPGDKGYDGRVMGGPMGRMVGCWNLMQRISSVWHAGCISEERNVDGVTSYCCVIVVPRN